MNCVCDHTVTSRFKSGEASARSSINMLRNGIRRMGGTRRKLQMLSPATEGQKVTKTRNSYSQPARATTGTIHVLGLIMRRRCYTENAPNAWQRRGTKKTSNTYNQPNRPNRQTSQTKHQSLPKGQPGRRITTINTAALHASAQQPTISTHTRQGHHQIFTANAARCEAQEQYRRAD